MKSLKQCLTILFGVAFLNASALGAHLHHCFDGKEPRVSVHLYDGPENLHHIGTSEKHNDKEVELSAQAFGKILKFDSSSSPLSHGEIAPVVARIATVGLLTPTDEHPTPFDRTLTPPQRGPPA